MRTLKLIMTGIVCLCSTGVIFSQQLKLGKNPYTVQKSAVLELNSDNQGLLLVRITDTASINLLSPPDGMIIYFIPTKQLFVRSGNFWKAIPLAETITNDWSLNGNTTGAIRKFGSVDNYDVSFLTNNTERLRMSNAGNIGINASVFDATYPEKLLIEAGTTTSVNLLKARGTVNNYLQLNLQNQSGGSSASSDIVATANNGSETANFIDMGINSGGFTDNTLPVLTGINNAYLYSTGNDFLIGNGTAAKNLRFFTGGYTTANERLRIDGSGNVGINVTTTPAATLEVNGTSKMGAKGTVTKNVISFSNAVSGTVTGGGFNVLGGSYSAGVLDVTITIPAATQPASTQATVAVSPSADLPSNVAIASARLLSATQVKVRFINASTSAAVLSGNLYITITEF